MIVFVGSNPSHMGQKSPAIHNLKKWLECMRITEYRFANVSDKVTPDNRPLKKSEYELDQLYRKIMGHSKIVALGSTASDALDRLGVAHFRLPHPSPRNRQLNDERHIASLLKACMRYLEVEEHQHA
jgi:hypothetical protein